MEIYLPTLEAKMVALVAAFRFIVFAIMVVGLVAYAAGSKAHGTGLFGILAKAIVIVAAVALMDTWFPKVEQVFLAIAEYVDPGYNEHPTSASDTIRESTTANPEGKDWSWRKLNQSIYQAMTNAMANIFYICRDTPHSANADPAVCSPLAAVLGDAIHASPPAGAGDDRDPGPVFPAVTRYPRVASRLRDYELRGAGGVE